MAVIGLAVANMTFLIHLHALPQRLWHEYIIKTLKY